MQRKQQGSALVVVLVLIIVGLVGFTGWYVWHSQKENDKTISQTNNASESTIVTPGVPTEASNTIETLTFSQVTKDLQTAIVVETTAKAPDCVKDDKIVDVDGKTTNQDVKYLASGFAETGIGCDGGAATIFAKVSGKWHVVGATQFEYKCADLKQYKVPVAFVKAVSADPTKAPTCIPADPNATEGEVYAL